MLIAVTGANGFLGRSVVASLADAGHKVRGLDSTRDPNGNADIVDLRDPYATRSHLAGCEGVVHLAGYPRAGTHTPHDVFTTNTGIAFSVIQAAQELQIKLVANVSSISVIGYPFYTQRIIPEYLPLDEQAQTSPQDAYGLSKVVVEEIITAAVLRAGGHLAAVSLRMPWLQSPQSFWRDIPTAKGGQDGLRNLWAYLDTRDAAAAVAAVFGRAHSGHTKLFISADDTFSDRPTAELVAEYFPQVQLRRELSGYSSLVETTAAREYLGFDPRHTWRSYKQGRG